MLIEVWNEARQHGQSFEMSEFLPQCWASTFENWQREWLQLLVQAVVLLGMKHLGIPPRDSVTRQELEDLQKVKSSSSE
jgi:hypothetical protein